MSKREPSIRSATARFAEELRATTQQLQDGLSFINRTMQHKPCVGREYERGGSRSLRYAQGHRSAVGAAPESVLARYPRLKFSTSPDFTTAPQTAYTSTARDFREALSDLQDEVTELGGEVEVLERFTVDAISFEVGATRIDGHANRAASTLAQAEVRVVSRDVGVQQRWMLPLTWLDALDEIHRVLCLSHSSLCQANRINCRSPAQPCVFTIRRPSRTIFLLEPPPQELLGHCLALYQAKGIPCLPAPCSTCSVPSSFDCLCKAHPASLLPASPAHSWGYAPPLPGPTYVV